MKLLILGLYLFVSSLGLVVYAAEGTPKGMKVIILMGPPGSGKGTQAIRITKELGIPHISTGDLFRENISNKTDLGKKARTFMDAGKLVPDEVVLDMLFDRVSRPDCAQGYLLDGFPRTIPQAQAFDASLSKNTQLIVLNLEVKDDVIIKRAVGRLSCKECGNIHNIYFSPPVKQGICDKCGGELVQRSDDKEEVVKERLRVYQAQTKPLVDYYSKKEVLISINGENSPDVVFKDLMKNLVSFKKK